MPTCTNRPGPPPDITCCRWCQAAARQQEGMQTVPGHLCSQQTPAAVAHWTARQAPVSMLPSHKLLVIRKAALCPFSIFAGHAAGGVHDCSCRASQARGTQSSGQPHGLAPVADHEGPRGSLHLHMAAAGAPAQLTAWLVGRAVTAAGTPDRQSAATGVAPHSLSVTSTQQNTHLARQHEALRFACEQPSPS